MKVIVVIPAFNEEKNIGRVVCGIKEIYNDFEIIVVDDGSGDKTAAAAVKNGAIVLRHLINRGQGAALKTGTDYAIKIGAEIIVHFDADGQFEPMDLAKMIAPVALGKADVTLGSRFLNNSLIKQMPLSKRFFLLPLARLVNFFFTGLWLTDAHNGFRVLSASAASKINIMHNGMAHNSEIIKEIKRLGFSFKEIGIAVYYKQYGQGVTGGLKIVRDLLIGRFLK